MDKRQFERHLLAEKQMRTEQQDALLARLERKLNLRPIAEPFEYVKALQANFDDSKIQYRQEYYDALGIEEGH